MSRTYPHLPKANTKPAVLQTLAKELKEDKTGQWVLTKLINGTYFFYPTQAFESWTKQVEHAETWTTSWKGWDFLESTEKTQNLRPGNYKIMKVVRHNNRLALLV